MDVKEALEWLNTKCYVENPQEEKFEECLYILNRNLVNAVIIPKATLEHWFDLLCVFGCKTKGMVRNDIQEVLKKNEC